jgi:transposase
MVHLKTINFVPKPRLVCVELNPGPGRKTHGRGIKLDEPTRLKIACRVVDSHKSIKGTARKYRIERNTVKSIVAKYKESNSVRDRPRRGRPPLLSSKDRRAVLKRAERGKTAPAISRAMTEKLKKPISESTIQRTIATSDMKYLVIEEEDELTSQQKAKRVQFAQNKLQFDWDYCLFTDEKDFQLGGGEHKAYQHPDRRIKRKVKPHPKKLHVWGGIGYYYKTKLHIFEGTLDAKRYQEIVRKNLPPEVSSDCPEGKEDDWIFVQDNDPKHKAKLTLKKLKELAPYYMTDFPAMSPEFNVIEDIWSQIDQKLKRYNINTIDKLKRHLKKAWDEVDFETVRKSVDSIPTRLKKCIEAKGDRFGY